MISAPTTDNAVHHQQGGCLVQRTRLTLGLTTGAILAALAAGVASAEEPANDYFQRTWERTDRPVATGAAQRTWMWGPEAFTGELFEPYAEAHNNGRAVQYFDKARMEINHDIDVPADSPWRVTNGLLVVELATGRLQLGDTTFTQRAPSNSRVAGDEDGAAPTYATIGALMASPAYQLGHVITERLAPDTTVVTDPSLAGLDVTAYYYVPETKHAVAEPFWYFLTSTQPVYENGQVVSDDLFEHPFYATGLPITEAYWVRTTLNGYETDILVQAFERRVLTYTPTNPAGWQVESGNVGRHYYAWRYGEQTAHTVVANIQAGPDTFEYRYGGQLPEQDTGPVALTVAADGTYWLADGNDNRLSRFDATGKRLNTIELADQGAQTIFDLEGRDGILWVSWANLNTGVYKLQAYGPHGNRVYDFDLPASIRQDRAYLTHGVTVNTDGEVMLDLEHGLRYVRVVTADGQLDATPLDAWAINGHSYRLEAVEGRMDQKRVVVDGQATLITADTGAMALQVDLLPAPDGSAFFNTRYSVYDDGTFHWTVERRANDGTLLGTASVPMDERYTYVRLPYAVSADGDLYMLMTYADHVEILRLGFTTP
jgi:hypothetical protein